MEEPGGINVVDNLARASYSDEQKPSVEVNESPIKWCSVSLSEIVQRGKRLEASVFDVEAKHAWELINVNKYGVVTIGGEEGLATAYTCGRFKRIWVKKSDYPIYQPSSIVDLYPTPDGYISKKTKVNIDSLRVHKGQILLTCSGTIGKTSLVSDTLDNAIFSHDLLRIDCKNPIDSGYVYTYLHSKIGSKILITNSYGAVITHIEAEHLASVPIPNAPAVIKSKINELIVKSYKLRDESNALIDEATKLLVDELHLPVIEDFDVSLYEKDAPVDTFSVKLSEMNGRVDASYHVPIVDAIVKHLKKYAAEVTTIGDKRISSDVVLPGRFKRVYVEEEYGITFFSGKNISELDPSDKKYLSFSQHDKKIKQELTIQKNMILLTCSGTVGNATLVPKHWDGWTMTHDIIRIIPQNNLCGYIYIWLNSVYCNRIILSYSYGSVVQHIEKEHILKCPVPLLRDQAIQSKINDLALEANAKRYEAYKLEQQALRIMDEEVIYAK